MSNKTLLLILPLCGCLVWLFALSAGTHLRWFEFQADDSNIPLQIGCYLVSFAFYFCVFLVPVALLHVAGVPIPSRMPSYVMGADVFLLLLVTIFPGTGYGLVAFNTRDLVFLPAATTHLLLAETGIIQEGEIPDPRPLEALAEALKSGNAEVRQKAVKALGARKDPRAVDALAAALKDEDWYVRGWAADALGRMNDPRAVEPLVDAWKRGDLKSGNSVEEALIGIDTPLAVNQMIAVLKDKHAEGLHEAAVKSLGKMGDQLAVAPLVSILKVRKLQAEVVDALGKIGDPRAVEPLIAVLEEKQTDDSYGSDQTRNAVIEALGKLKDRRAVAPLISLLEGEDWYVKWIAAKALGEIGDRRAVEPLVGALGDTDTNVQEHAAIALAKIKDARAVEPLIAVLQGSDSTSLREAAAWALGEMEDPRVVAPLIAALGKDRSLDVRKWAAYALGKTRDYQALDPLVASLKRGPVEVRIASAHSLREFNEIGAVEPLIVAQKDREQSVRWEATLSLEHSRDRKAAIAVEKFLKRFDIARVAQNYESIIRNGESDKDYALVFALIRHGTERMAHDFVTSGHGRLEDEGEEWLKRHGLAVNHGLRSGAPLWGQQNR